jgi:nucleoside-diphosphate-sugar epimerase
MCAQMINRVIVSGAKGFVGKNLRKFLSKNKNFVKNMLKKYA